jgi:hypothetical protein
LCHPVFHVFLSTDVYTSCSVGTLLFCFVPCASTWFVRMRTHARACARRFQEIMVSNIGRNGNPVPHSTHHAASGWSVRRLGSIPIYSHRACSSVVAPLWLARMQKQVCSRRVGIKWNAASDEYAHGVVVEYTSKWAFRSSPCNHARRRRLQN